MAGYHINEGELEIPKGWEDKTVNGFTFPVGSKKPSASLAVTRDPSKPDLSLAAYIDKQLVDMAKSCPRFDLLRRDDVIVDGKSAVQVEFTWRTPDGSYVRQQQTILQLPTGVFLTITATAPKDKFQMHANAFQSFVESFRFRKEE